MRPATEHKHTLFTLDCVQPDALQAAGAVWCLAKENSSLAHARLSEKQRAERFAKWESRAT